MLRLRAVSALAPLAADVVVTGHDRDHVGLLIFGSPAAKELSTDALRDRVRAALQALRDEGGGTSQTPTLARLLDEPPNADAGEITDKGYINQRAVLRRRSAEVEALYRATPDPGTVRM
jgi:feruloyl-CoA synthase